jgi:hypothetical protein
LKIAKFFNTSKKNYLPSSYCALTLAVSGRAEQRTACAKMSEANAKAWDQALPFVFAFATLRLTLVRGRQRARPDPVACAINKNSGPA